MRKGIGALLGFALLLVAMLGSAGQALAQTATTGVISGRVTDASGQPRSAVEITVRNESTGVVRTTTTNENGLYLVPGLQVGGPYTVAASGLGVQNAERRDLRLALGQNLVVNFDLAETAFELEGIEVEGVRTRDQVINPNRTGAEQLVTERQIETLPTISRNFTDFIKLSPAVGAGGGATSVGQQNNRFNNIQIDGAITQDVFGLGSTGQPGGQAGARSISLDAVEQYQVLVAPFDVRQSGFSGGLINAVTKSGTNDFTGSAYLYYRDLNFVREDLVVEQDTFSFNEFDNQIFGFSLGGPVMRDKIHFFTAVEIENDQRPAGGVVIGENTPAQTRVSQADADRFVNRLDALGVNPGSYGAFTVENPNRNIFGRLDFNLSNQHRLMLRHNWVRAEDDVVTNRGGFTSYSLDSNFYFFESNTNSTVAQLSSTLRADWYNELTGSWTRIRDRRSPVETFPVIQVRVPNPANPAQTTSLLAGAEYFSQGNELDQDVFEITNNLTIPMGDHRLTFGIHDEYFRFRNLFQAGKTGEWTFNSMADFEAGTPSNFRRSVPALSDIVIDPVFGVHNFGIYGQTEWTASQNVIVTAGLRYDLPIMPDDPYYNPLVESALGRRTDELPSGNGTLSPRLGFNWDVYGDRSTQVRGGAGLFTGRQPFVWLSNLYGNTGLSAVTVSCSASGGNLPAFTIDPDNQPSQCASGGLPAPPRAVINLIDPDFQFPSNWRFNLAADRELLWGIVGTAEFVYTRAHKQILLAERNVNFSSPVTTTQGGRPVFGTIRNGIQSGSNTSFATPNRLSTAVDAVVELTNSDEDRSWSATAQLQKRYSDGIEFTSSYTYSKAKDLSGLTSSIATSNIGFNPVAGSPNNPLLSRSDYETPHKLVLAGSWDVQPWLTWSMFYVGASGDGYAYVYDGDVNADGFEAAYASNRYNDLLYVPENAADISLVNPTAWADLNAYIESEECLRENRGRIMERNSCREPWQNQFDTRFTFRVPTMRGQRAEISLDILNVANLLNQEWGVIEYVPNPTIELLELRGWDAANNRGYFQPTSRLRVQDGAADQFSILSGASRWQMQLGVRYAF
jgi:hypothetical protein